MVGRHETFILEVISVLKTANEPSSVNKVGHPYSRPLDLLLSQLSCLTVSSIRQTFIEYLQGARILKMGD